MDDIEIIKMFQPLWADLRPEDAFAVKKPLLAHYTTIQTLEKILSSSEVWFSNPLFMNDLDRTSFFRIDKALSALLFVTGAGGVTGYDPG